MRTLLTIAGIALLLYWIEVLITPGDVDNDKHKRR